MSFKDYLHEKAEESRHNELTAYLMFLAGAVFFTGGIIETLSLGGTPEWFLFITYFTQPYPGAVLGLALTVSGFGLLIYGVAAGINYSRDRRWYIQEMRKANSLEEIMLKDKTANNKHRKKKETF